MMRTKIGARLSSPSPRTSRKYCRYNHVLILLLRVIIIQLFCRQEWNNYCQAFIPRYTVFKPVSTIQYSKSTATRSRSRIRIRLSSNNNNSEPSSIQEEEIPPSNHETIEPYIGPISSLTNMEGGIAIQELALHVLAGPSLVAPGRGLFLSIYEDMDNLDDNDNDNNMIEEIVIPQGTPLCGYARGYFTDEASGDKSVGFLFQSSDVDTAGIFYEKQFMTLGDAICRVYKDRISTYGDDSADVVDESSLLFGHIVNVQNDNDNENNIDISLSPDQEFASRIFIPDTISEDDGEHLFSASRLGVYANDLAYDPDGTQEDYTSASERNNVLQLVWRLAKDETKGGMLVPTWPVIVARTDIRMVNTVPMEVGLQYGYNYWDSFLKEKK